ncbi:hypothetical protein POM88_035201 [Heracleum sosnowskyi]|uniref:Uncharacterized protein n=1 Tax=Heracleum sosnowskyi TaxID=360622 RepID=A0AAD8MDV9_9APIA|nr:hypothetical protein POM88_035201 [Heracleum sosnowskyi]
MSSYEEVVISQLKQMREDNHLLICFQENKVEKLTKELKFLRGSFNALGEKMRKVSEENRIVRQTTKMHHKEIKEEDMDLAFASKDEFQKSAMVLGQQPSELVAPPARDWA